MGSATEGGGAVNTVGSTENHTGVWNNAQVSMEKPKIFGTYTTDIKPINI